MTISEALIFGAEELKEQTNPLFEAEYMLSFALKQSRLYIKTNRDEQLSEDAEKNYRDYIALRKNDYPAAYIIGTREFYGLELAVAPGVLIPRQETELLAEKAAELLKDIPEPYVCDMGTGSGAISIVLAHLLPRCRILACDISPDALNTARMNIERFRMSDRIKPVLTNYFSALKGHKFDVIVSNPPYIPTSVIDTLDTCVKDYEPVTALDGGADGLDAYRILFSQGRDFLKPGGVLICEIGYDQGKTVPALAEGFGTEVLKDLAGLDRIVIARPEEELNDGN